MNVRQAVAWMSQPGIMAGIHDRMTREAVKTLIKAITEGERVMKLKNKAANMEIGYVNSSGQKKLYIQVGNERQYYGALMTSKADQFLEMLKQWDEAGGSDE